MTHGMEESMQWLRWAIKFSKSKHLELQAGFSCPKETGRVIHMSRYATHIGRPSFRFHQRWYDDKRPPFCKGWFPKLKYEK